MKTILFVRHSIPEKFNVKTEDLPLSKEGIIQAKQFFQLPIFHQVNHVYSSTYLRALQTAQIFTNQIIQDNRLIERLIGDLKTANKSQWKKQYENHDYKNIDGESLNEVKQRMSECVYEILENMNENETSIVVSHATSICSYLLNECDICVTNDIEKIRKIIFKDKIVLEGKINKPSCFKVLYENYKIIDITYYE